MCPDPHEPGHRVTSFAKDERDEEFFHRLNLWLHQAPLPEVETELKVEQMPLIYIVGAPRSGTTLLYQLLCRYLPVGYINNLSARFWLRPSVGIRLSRTILGDQDRELITFRSTHAVSEGPAGPHEFGYFWRYWLHLDECITHHLSAAELEKVDKCGLKHALEREVISSFGCPVVFKNVICGFHARFLTDVHQPSVFVHIKRDTYATAASILKTRMERYHSYSAWWSLKPSTYGFKTQPCDPAMEVIRQVIDCRREIDQELSSQDVRACSVTYEDLCADPGEILNAICSKLQECGMPLSLVSQDMPRLTCSEPASLPEDLDRMLRLHSQECQA